MTNRIIKTNKKFFDMISDKKKTIDILFRNTDDNQLFFLDQMDTKHLNNEIEINEVVSYKYKSNYLEVKINGLSYHKSVKDALEYYNTKLVNGKTPIKAVDWYTSHFKDYINYKVVIITFSLVK